MKARAKAKGSRTVFGRLKNVEGPDGRFYVIKLRRDGLVVRRRCCRRAGAEVVPLARLCCGGARRVDMIGRGTLDFTLAEDGLEIKAGRNRKVLTWVELANLVRRQPDLFPQLKGGG